MPNETKLGLSRTQLSFSAIYTANITIENIVLVASDDQDPTGKPKNGLNRCLEMGESAEELKHKMQAGEGILNDSTAVNHISETQNGFGSLENNVDAGGDHPNGVSNHNISSNKQKEDSKSKDGSSSSKHKDHHSSSSKHREGHKSSSSSSKHRDGHSSSSSKPKDGSSSSPTKSSSDKQKDSHSKDKHHSSSDKKHSSSEHKSHSKSSSSDKHKDGSSKSSSDKPREGSSKSSSSGDKHRDGSSKSSSGDKHRDGSSKSSSDKHRDSSTKSSSDKHKDGSKSSSDKHKDGSSKSLSSTDKHKDSSSRPSSDKHKDGTKSSSEKHKSSSSDKHKDGSSKSTSDKHRDGSSKTSSDKHRDGSKSSSSADKHKDVNKSPDKHKERSKESSSSDKHKDRPKDGSGSMSPEKHSSSPEKHSSSPEKHSSSPEKHSSSPDKHSDKGSIKAEENGEDFVNDAITRRISLESEMKPVSIELEKIEMDGEQVHVDLDKSDEDEVPLSARIKAEVVSIKREREESSDDEPLSARMKKVKKEDDDFKPKKRKKEVEEDDYEEDFEPVKKKKKTKNTVKGVNELKTKARGKKKAEEEHQVWKWWEEEKRDDGVKWTYLEHKGPVFAPLYDRLPKKVKFHYHGKEMHLSRDTEEVAGFYAKMLDHDYTSKDVFNNNFFRDWRKVMTRDEKEIITDLSKCNFKEMHAFFLQQSEDRKNRTKEEKKELKLMNEEITKEYGFCIIDGHKEKIGNFRIEPPGLFRGRGDHPKQGRLKKRVEAEEVIINCSSNSKIPVAPDGHKWKEVRHDNNVTWLASWTENIQGATKYVMLNAASKLKGEKDWQKYEIARKLHKCVDKIRATYRENWKSKEMRVRQRAVALYFIDKLALRAGNEKEEGETADTVGCCSLRVEHIKLFTAKNGKECVCEFDFLGKDSIRYQNSVPVERRVFKNLQLFVENKQQDDDLFDRLNTTLMNKHLHDLMEGLTAKVFRTYNASRTLQEQLDLLTNEDEPIAAKLLSYNRANRAVAILCNHQRSAPKTFAQSMENLINKVDDKRKQVKEAKKDIKDAKSDYKNHNTERNRAIVEKKKKALKRLEEQLTRLEVQATDKEENKEIALGTSKLNYLDPRISVAWCKKWDVPVEKVYNKTQRDKFRWAIDMATEDFKF